MLMPSLSNKNINTDSFNINNLKERLHKEQSKELIILEIANNHMGNVDHGIKIIDELAKIKESFSKYFDFAIKFQFRDLNSFIHPSFKGSNLKFVKRFESTKLTKKEWNILFNRTKKYKFKLLATPFDEKSVKKILELNFKMIKIASCSLTDWPLVERISLTRKEVIFSTAGSSIEEIDSVVSFFQNRGIKFTLLHCVGKYPTENKLLNIGAIDFYRKRYPNIDIGFSTHEKPNNILSAPLALAMGAKVFEKHVGINTNKFKLNDYSANPIQINEWLESLKQAKLMVGSRNKRVKIKNEKEELRGLQRGVFLNKDLKRGEKVNIKDMQLCIPSDGEGIVANDLSKYKDLFAKKSIKKGSQLSNINCKVIDNRILLLSIVKKIKVLVNKSEVSIPNGVDLEISHHYGLDKFFKQGISMFNIVNYEYCKKIIAVFPNQKHPEQYHKIKKETFHILYGDLKLKLDGKNIVLKPKDIITINPGEKHAFSSKSGCIFEEISSNHKINDSYYTDSTILKNKNRKTFIKFWR